MDRTDRTLNLDWSGAQYVGGGVYVLDSTHHTGTPSVALRADRGEEQHVILMEKRAFEILTRYREMTLTWREELQEARTDLIRQQALQEALQEVRLALQDIDVHPNPGRLGQPAGISESERKERMKAISLWQPYASLIAAGVKTIETRGWAPPKDLTGQRIAIHAAKAIETSDVRGRERHRLIAAALDDPEWDGSIPRGAVVCTAVLDHTAQVTGPEHNGQVTVAGNGHPVPVDEWGDFSPGRWLWFLRDVEPVDPPVPARGRQGFWNWERRSGTPDAGSDESDETGASGQFRPHPGYSHRQEKRP